MIYDSDTWFLRARLDLAETISHHLCRPPGRSRPNTARARRPCFVETRINFHEARRKGRAPIFSVAGRRSAISILVKFYGTCPAPRPRAPPATLALLASGRLWKTAD
ncbi:hypothetical protein EVAR_37030_1 [Eumeta japonica]|uniref:Uncharacterized protein n=1 Tax=Eumeta variegata TaxID=151549 RepID=A0A4C1WIH7_EUMVA|nr:hypothetical protein EVAR_37030_1 [Eumeta japonica]